MLWSLAYIIIQSLDVSNCLTPFRDQNFLMKNKSDDFSCQMNVNKIRFMCDNQYYYEIMHVRIWN